MFIQSVYSCWILPWINYMYTQLPMWRSIYHGISTVSHLPVWIQNSFCENDVESCWYGKIKTITDICPVNLFGCCVCGQWHVVDGIQEDSYLWRASLMIHSALYYDNNIYMSDITVWWTWRPSYTDFTS